MLPSAPLIGSSLGPLLGGALTQGLDWRATFYFLGIFTGLCVLAFLAFEDTFRKERSAVYTAAVRRRRKEQERKALKEARERELGSHGTVVESEPETKEISEKHEKSCDDRTKEAALPPPSNPIQSQEILGTPHHVVTETPTASAPKDAVKEKKQADEIRLSLRDVNPVVPMILVLRRLNNVAILTASGLIYGFAYCIAYTCSRILSEKYGFDALKIGFVLLSYGVGEFLVTCTLARPVDSLATSTGSMFGSILGGRWSDRVFKKLKEKSGGTSKPEVFTRKLLCILHSS